MAPQSLDQLATAFIVDNSSHTKNIGKGHPVPCASEVYITVCHDM